MSNSAHGVARHTPDRPPTGSHAPAGWDELQIVRRFRAMNTHIELHAMQPRYAFLLAGAEAIIQDVEARFSRFDPASELSRFNARGDASFVASSEMIALVMLALTMHRRTRRVFDPAILPGLEAAGYDRSFELVARDGVASSRSSGVASSIAAIAIRGDAIMAPTELRIDLGGIGKGYAVDLAGTHLRPAGDYLISAGGDMFAAGNGPGGDGWLASVAPAPGDAPRSIVRLHDEALATSTTAVRTWQRDGERRHHVIDPRTQRPCESGVTAVSVIAPSAVEADVFAKTALMLGVEGGTEFLASQHTSGFFIGDDGRAIPTPDWPGTIA